MSLLCVLFVYTLTAGLHSQLGLCAIHLLLHHHPHHYRQVTTTILSTIILSTTILTTTILSTTILSTTIISTIGKTERRLCVSILDKYLRLWQHCPGHLCRASLLYFLRHRWHPFHTLRHGRLGYLEILHLSKMISFLNVEIIIDN